MNKKEFGREKVLFNDMVGKVYIIPPQSNYEVCYS